MDIIQRGLYHLDWQQSGDLKSDHSKSGLFESRISNGRALAIAPTIQKPDSIKHCLTQVKDFYCEL